MDSQIITLKIELEALKKERDAASRERADNVRKTLQEKQSEASKLEAEWKAEKDRLEKVKRARYHVWASLSPFSYSLLPLWERARSDV